MTASTFLQEIQEARTRRREQEFARLQAEEYNQRREYQRFIADVQEVFPAVDREELALSWSWQDGDKSFLPGVCTFSVAGIPHRLRRFYSGIWFLSWPATTKEGDPDAWTGASIGAQNLRLELVNYFAGKGDQYGL
jgi:hypothetical protein